MRQRSYRRAALWGVLLCLFLMTPTLDAQEEGATAPTAAARLLEGELIELGEGDTAAALEIYQGLLERDDLDADVRARTLFALGRAHRKRGELGAAQARYQELIATYPQQGLLVKAAHRYVAEIREGAQRLPDFDWVAQVEQNPEIQAQIFEWGMQLVSADNEQADLTAEVASRKLLALGSTVVPVLEPMLERTSDVRHRRELAWTLIQLGQFKHIATYLSVKENPPTEFSRFLVRLDEKNKAEVRELLPTLSGMPRETLARMRVALGVFESLEEDVAHLGGEYGLLDAYWGEAAMAERLRRALVRRASESFSSYVAWVTHIVDVDPQQLTDAELAPFDESHGERRFGISSLVERLVKLDRGKDALRILVGPQGGLAQQQRRSRSREAFYWSDWSKYGVPVSAATRARIYRRMGRPTMVLGMALRHDSAIRELLPALRDVLWQNQRHLELSAAFVREIWIGKLGQYAPLSAEDKAPVGISPALQKLMREAFVAEEDPWLKSVALELLLRAMPHAEAATVEFLKEWVDKPLDPAHRWLVTWALVRAGSLDDALCGRMLASLPNAEDSWQKSVLVYRSEGHGSGGERFYMRVGSSSIAFRSDRSFNIGWELWSNVVKESSPEFQRFFEGELGPEKAKLASALLGEATGSGDQIVFESELVAALDRCAERDSVRAVLADVRFVETAVKAISPAVATIALEEESLSASFRANLFARFPALLDWQVMLGDDPLAMPLLKRREAKEFLQPHIAELRLAKQVVVRRWAWKRSYELSAQELVPGLADSDDWIRSQAFEHLVAAEHAEFLPLLHNAAKSGPLERRLAAIARVTEFADASSFDVIRALLSDPILSIKSLALESLKTMEETQKERAKWSQSPPKDGR